VSLFSGAGGFELGFLKAGIETILQVEIDPWCRAILERHWPDCERVHDVREVDAATLSGRARDVARAGRGADAQRPRHARGRSEPAAVGGVDLVYGGFPCQDVSVAGARAGFGGERSSLWHEFHRVLRELRPRWCVVENVPGLFSSGARPGADFSVLLRGLVDLGYGVAWRTLDARWFGVPQRRRRVFVVGCLGDAARAAQVLAVCESCGGHPAEGREAGQDVAFTLAGGSPDTSRRISNAWNTTYLPTASTLSGGGHADGVNLPGRHHEDDDNLVIGSEVDDGMARPLVARGTGYRMDVETENFVVADPIGTREGKTYTHEGKNNFRAYNLIADTLRVEYGEQAFRGDGADNLFAFSSKGGGGGALDGEDDLAPTIVGTDGNGGVPPAIAFDWQASAGNDESWRGKGRQHVVRSGDYAGATSATRVDAVSSSAGVRRLTPLECERLMGWPDDWTRWTADGKELPDSHRYRLCGNGVVATVAEWIGHRLVAVDETP